jgi:hypothetical protein
MYQLDLSPQSSPQEEHSEPLHSYMPQFTTKMMVVLDKLANSFRPVPLKLKYDMVMFVVASHTPSGSSLTKIVEHRAIKNRVQYTQCR